MKQTKCLLVHPRFTSGSFWNYRATCELRGAKYPATPLGLITVAALLPENWDCRLRDCNVETLDADDIAWADIVFVGGMIAQQVASLALIADLKRQGKMVVVGGPDATSSPHLYDAADYLVLGEAEITLPRWLADYGDGRAAHKYECGAEKADMSTSPVPRFDLLKFHRYLHVGVQHGRGCPFNCEFCDIIELFGRVPRLKSADQVLSEIQTLYDLGYRGHIDFVDDNFIGNKREVMKMLPPLKLWLEEHKWPFEFTTEASINLADDDALLQMMQEVGFFAIFVGIESAEEETLVAMQKRQNTRRSQADCIKKIYSHGIFVNAGYIIGFDTEKGNVADSMMALVEESAVPVNMVGLLFALPNTQLTRRLKIEGRLREFFEVVDDESGDQCTGGLNFDTVRPRREILEDYRRVIANIYAPKAYLSRVVDMGTRLNCSKKKLRLPLREHRRDLMAFGRLMWRMGVKKPYRMAFWKTLGKLAWRNPRGLRYTIAMLALYMHFDTFSQTLLARLDKDIQLAKAADRTASESITQPAVDDATAPPQPNDLPLPATSQPKSRRGKTA